VCTSSFLSFWKDVFLWLILFVWIEAFGQEIENGLIELVQIPVEFYPLNLVMNPCQLSSQKFEDTLPSIISRSKKVNKIPFLLSPSLTNSLIHSFWNLFYLFVYFFFLSLVWVSEHSMKNSKKTLIDDDANITNLWLNSERLWIMCIWCNMHQHEVIGIFCCKTTLHQTFLSGVNSSLKLYREISTTMSTILWLLQVNYISSQFFIENSNNWMNSCYCSENEWFVIRFFHPSNKQVTQKNKLSLVRLTFHHSLLIVLKHPNTIVLFFHIVSKLWQILILNIVIYWW
jgi:hypothetical protein